jgi:hypothetical protein
VPQSRARPEAALEAEALQLAAEGILPELVQPQERELLPAQVRLQVPVRLVPGRLQAPVLLVPLLLVPARLQVPALPPAAAPRPTRASCHVSTASPPPDEQSATANDVCVRRATVRINSPH